MAINGLIKLKAAKNIKISAVGKLKSKTLSTNFELFSNFNFCRNFSNIVLFHHKKKDTRPKLNFIILYNNFKNI